MAGAFITFEGIDGCGKSTQLRLLASELRVRGLEIVTTREPGGTTLGKRLRAALLDVDEQVDPLAELLVFAADRAHHVRTLLLPALETNQIVFSDRYADATAAYQGAGRGFEPDPPPLPFATDFGSISRRAPAALIGVGRSEGWAFHSDEGAAQFASPAGVDVATDMATVLALATVRLSEPWPSLVGHRSAAK